MISVMVNYTFLMSILYFIFQIQLKVIYSYEVVSQLIELNQTALSYWYGSCNAYLLKNLKDINIFQKTYPFDSLKNCEKHCLHNDHTMVIPKLAS